MKTECKIVKLLGAALILLLLVAGAARTATQQGNDEDLKNPATGTLGGGLQTHPPLDRNVAAGTTVDLSFTVLNAAPTATQASLYASDTAGWGTWVGGATSITVPAYGSAPVTVRVSVPNGATAGQASTASLIAHVGKGPRTAAATVLRVVNPGYRMTPDALDFGTVPIGGTTVSDVTIANTGETVLALGALGKSDRLTTPFTIGADACSGALLEPGAACSFRVKFTPVSDRTFRDDFPVPILEPVFMTRNFSVTGAGRSGIAVGVAPGPEGVLSCIPDTVTPNTTTRCTATARTPNYRVATISGCGIDYLNRGNGESTRTETTGPVTDACTVTATFAPDKSKHKLVVNKEGRGTVVGFGIDCGIDCDNTYTHGTSVSLAIEAEAGYEFLGWAGGGCDGTGSCNLTMEEDFFVTASFGCVLPLPVAQELFMYEAIPFAPFLRGECSVEGLTPIGVGPAAANYRRLLLNLWLPLFDEAVDVYVLFYGPELDPDNVNLLLPGGGVQSISEGWTPWAAGSRAEIHDFPWHTDAPGGIYLRPGPYQIGFMVMPKGGDLSGPYYLWVVSFTVE